ncbi:C39 family peptidase [Micromonospora sp. U56]|uniref:C39 family peptidase n=1 Tax=Micromonospora sp. U56 TaxID=2824900 RepID=UPI001B388EBF|nr:C39 family peptidase [Micromonospora sp. U56]MBQ0895196.1 C39 family peptidase [Micromonospora sp. U56]
MIPGAPTSAQIDQIQADIVNAVTDGRAVLANTVGTGVDTDGGWHSFPGGHYIAVVGYKDNRRSRADRRLGEPTTAACWMTTVDLANWMATRATPPDPAPALGHRLRTESRCPRWHLPTEASTFHRW